MCKVFVFLIVSGQYPKEDSVDSQMSNNFMLLPFSDTYLIGMYREIFSESLPFVHSLSA